MPRYRLTIEYDGRPFVGWQRQANGLSVQEVIETALGALEYGSAIVIRGAGRTDAGVHASGQVAHVDLMRVWSPDRLRDAINAHLRPSPVAVLACATARDDFDARFSATRRHYVYRIVNRRAPLAIDAGRAWLVKRKLDCAAMHLAAQRLVGAHDFSTFRDSDCQAASPCRTLDYLACTRQGDAIIIETNARSFLHSQVRSIVGSLEHVGSGKWTASDLSEALLAKDRSRCGTVAPPYGLYLAHVDYDD